MNSKGMSLRWKLMMFFGLLSFASLLAYMLLAIRIFESDKIAYVFDSSTNFVASIGSQVRSQLNATVASYKPLLQDYLEHRDSLGKGSFSSVGKKFFQDDKTLENFAIYKMDPQQHFQVESLLEKKSGSFSEIIGQNQVLFNRLFSLSAKTDRLIQAPWNDERFFILLSENIGQDRYLFILNVRLPEISEIFHTSQGDRTLFLADASLNWVQGPKDFKNSFETELFPQLKLGQSVLTQSAQEMTTNKNNQPDLVSIAKVGFGNLWVVSQIPKAKALTALQLLMRQSIFFFIFILGIVGIVSWLGSRTLTASLSHLYQATQKISQGDFQVNIPISSHDEVGALAQNFNEMAKEVSRLLSQTAEKARMENELKTAQMVQETLFPATNAQLSDLQLSGFYAPASECGGDWWYYSEIQGKILFWIGDATGHGASAALLTSAAKSAATLIETMSVEPAKILELLNRSIYEVSKGKLMMTFFVAQYDPQTGIISYANASHEPPFLIRKSDTYKKKNLEPLVEHTNPRLGHHGDTQYQQAKFKLEDGDQILFYTDGIADIRSPEDEAWGERKWLKSFTTVLNNHATAQQTVTEFTDNFQKFRNNTTLKDDVTFFLIKKGA